MPPPHSAAHATAGGGGAHAGGGTVGAWSFVGTPPLSCAELSGGSADGGGGGTPELEVVSTLRVLLRADDRGVIAKLCADALAAACRVGGGGAADGEADATALALGVLHVVGASGEERARCGAVGRDAGGLPLQLLEHGAAGCLVCARHSAPPPSGGAREVSVESVAAADVRLELPPLGAWTHGARVGAALGELLSAHLPRCGVADGTATHASLALASLAMRAAHALHASGTLVVRPDGADGGADGGGSVVRAVAALCARPLPRLPLASDGRLLSREHLEKQVAWLGSALRRDGAAQTTVGSIAFDPLPPPAAKEADEDAADGAAPAVIAPVVPLVAVSSAKRGKEKEHLFDGSLTSYWQSDGSSPSEQRPHWVELTAPLVAGSAERAPLGGLRIFCKVQGGTGGEHSSYCPAVVRVKTGTATPTRAQLGGEARARRARQERRLGDAAHASGGGHRAGLPPRGAAEPRERHRAPARRRGRLRLPHHLPRRRHAARRRRHRLHRRRRRRRRRRARRR